MFESRILKQDLEMIVIQSFHDKCDSDIHLIHCYDSNAAYQSAIENSFRKKS